MKKMRKKMMGKMNIENHQMRKTDAMGESAEIPPFLLSFPSWATLASLGKKEIWNEIDAMRCDEMMRARPDQQGQAI